MPLVRVSPTETIGTASPDGASTPSTTTTTDLADLRTFLAAADLTLAGLGAPSPRLHLRIDRDPTGTIVGSTG
jgi:hypothetical protein